MICHNAQFEHKFCLSMGINANIIHDTKLMAGLYNDRLPKKLGELGDALGIGKILRHGPEIMTMQGQELINQNISHTVGTYKIAEYLWPRLSEEEKQVYKRVLMPATKSLAQIELEGVCIDKRLLKKFIKETEEKLAKCLRDPAIRKTEKILGTPFNPKGEKDRHVLIYEVLGFECPDFCRTKKTGKPSTRKSTLLYLNMLYPNKHLTNFIEASKLSGLLTGSLYPMLNDHIVRVGDRWFVFSNLWLGETSTQRIKSSNPNLQNLAKTEMRRMFVSRHRNGLICEHDYDGIELRIVASLAEDEKLIDGILNGDPHKATAVDLFHKKAKSITKKEREFAKKFNYGVTYGGGAYKIAVETGLPLKEIKVYLNRFWKAHSTLYTYYENYIEGDVIYSPTGIKRHFTRITEAINHPGQNVALVVMLMAMNKVVPFMKEHGAIVDLTIHDSLRSDLKKSQKKLIMPIKELMESIHFPFMKVPFTVTPKIGPNWYDMEEYKNT